MLMAVNKSLSVRLIAENRTINDGADRMVD